MYQNISNRSVLHYLIKHFFTAFLLQLVTSKTVAGSPMLPAFQIERISLSSPSQNFVSNQQSNFFVGSRTISNNEALLARIFSRHKRSYNVVEECQLATEQITSFLTYSLELSVSLHKKRIVFIFAFFKNKL